MNKRGRFLGLGVVGTLALLASLIVASASAVAQDGELPDFGDLNSVMSAPVQAASVPQGDAEPTSAPPGQPGQNDRPTSSDSPTAAAVPVPSLNAAPERAAAATPARSPRVSIPAVNPDVRGACTIYSSYSTSRGEGWPALVTPAGTVTARDVSRLLGERFLYGVTDYQGNPSTAPGAFLLSASRNCTSVTEIYRRQATNGEPSGECYITNPNYPAWNESASTGSSCVRTWPRSWWT